MPTTRNRLMNIGSLKRNTHFLSNKKNALILCLLIIIPLFLFQIKPTSAATLRVPSEYLRIKDALVVALTGDTIEVDSGTYYENNIIIENTITALSIIGAGPQTTIIDGMGNGTIFELDGTHVYITGFTLRNAGTSRNAISSEKPGPSPSNDYHMIINNIIADSAYGISLSLSNQNTIVNNTFINNELGAISLATSTTNNITRNNIQESAYGIRIYNSPTNTLAANTMTSTSYGVYITGITSTGNIVKNNIIAGRTAGIYSGSDTTTIDHNTLIDGASAIYLQGKTATINYNIIQNSSYGIRLYYTSATTTSHQIRNNKITNSDWAIEASYSYSNTFKANWIQDNTWGIYMAFCYSNTFYQNNFINNTVQTAAGVGTNTWSSGGQGNYWSDYEGVDANLDGIGDTPYLVSPIGQDNYPLMDTWSEHDVSVENITTDATEAQVGLTVNITVTVKNKGRIGAAETFTITAKCNETSIQTQEVTNLAADATQNLTFNWNTAYLNAGNYSISAQASIVTNELNTDNNNRVDGTVQITRPLIGDINADGTVDDLDLELLTQIFGATPQSSNWNSNADLIEDNIIDAHDLRLLGENYGTTV